MNANEGLDERRLGEEDFIFMPSALLRRDNQGIFEIPMLIEVMSRMATGKKRIMENTKL
jgi:hypothetical protein